ncbi:MAG: endonuclease III domain-containing protein [Desulfoplanes sp.]
MHRKTLLLNMYGAMLDRLGSSHWCPGDTPFEIAVGVILAQNTNWQNASKAVFNLKNLDLFSAPALYALPEEDLAEHIRPAGYFRMKASRLKHFLSFLRTACRFDMELLKSQEMETLREKLLQVRGIGPETTDAILLYALDKPSFVVDAYTARILNRHCLMPENVSYPELREYFMEVLDPDIRIFSEFHALLIRVGKTWCKKKAGLCASCPLADFLE